MSTCPPVAFEGRGHLHISCPVLEMVDFGFAGVYSSCELIDAAVGFSKALVGGCCLLVHHGDKAVDNGMHGVLEVATVIHAEYCFS